MAKLRSAGKTALIALAGLVAFCHWWGSLPVTAPALAADCSAGYAQGPGGYYRQDDRSGPYFISSGCVAVPVSGAVTAGGVPQADTVVRSVAVYKGGSIAAANTSQTLLDSNSVRRGFTVQNQSSGDLYIKVGQTATTNNLSLRIAPGATYETPPQHVSGGVVNIIGATAGQLFYATEY